MLIRLLLGAWPLVTGVLPLASRIWFLAARLLGGRKARPYEID